MHMVIKWRHCYFKVTLSCKIASLYIQELLGVYFKIEIKMLYLIVSKKKNPLIV